MSIIVVAGLALTQEEWAEFEPTEQKELLMTSGANFTEETVVGAIPLQMEWPEHSAPGPISGSFVKGSPQSGLVTASVMPQIADAGQFPIDERTMETTAFPAFKES